MSTAPAEPRHLLHVFSTFDVGGPQVRFAALANRFGARYRHSIVAMDGRWGCFDRLDTSLDVTRIDLSVRKGGALSLANLRNFRAQLRDLQPDLLLTYNWGAIEWALANRFMPLARHIHCEDGFGPEEAQGQLGRRVWLRRLALSGQSRILVPSRTLARLAEQHWDFSPRRIVHIPNGIDCARFAEAEGPPPPQLAALAPDMVVIGSVGALRPEKNFARLLRAFAALPEGEQLRLALAGEGPERAALEALAAELGIADRVLFLGRLEAPETALARFDIFALSSDTEQMPLGLIEAMAAGLPVVATDVGDVRAMVTEANAPMVCETNDTACFAAGLDQLLGDPEQRRALGKANRARAFAEYDEALMAKRYDALFSDEAASASQSPAMRRAAL